ncbi:MAG: hypothetical protein AVDCRST_MAG75-144 [uncultured Propionibacteriaceae bacterium]|uniref:Secreted protein n=1 Tax=uncultured Propionibacteriaceae bacterium TaxID=257457 RepID=A0A6J4N0S5_9ACTN|nr:MAG: hypothetical protein AVDCRST_MAG75-144 [uncultured Propionibacteriaceae bacterium]
MTGWELSTVATVACWALVISLVAGWRLSRLAARLHRAQHRVERAWAALDAALVRRAERAVELVADPRLDPATALLMLDAAQQTLEAAQQTSEPTQDRCRREQAESRLSQVLAMVAVPGIEVEQHRAVLARQLHNDAVVTARALRHRRGVQLFRLGGQAEEPTAFEMAESDRRAVRTGGTPDAVAAELVWRQC